VNLPTCSLKFPTCVAPLRWAGLLRCWRPLTTHQLEGALAAHDHTGRRHRRARVASQVQVQVTNARGSSATGKILPPLESSLPPDCQCEVAPAPTEFDYIPTPAITSVSTSATDPGSLASEKGGTLITVTGKGFDGLTLLWADFGNPGLASSMSYAITYLTGTEMQILARAQPLTTEPATVPFSVRTLAGQSPGSISPGARPDTLTCTGSSASDACGRTVTLTWCAGADAALLQADNAAGTSSSAQIRATSAKRDLRRNMYQVYGYGPITGKLPDWTRACASL
jgi:hypothetical protein